MTERADQILATIHDLVLNFVVYDRKSDDQLPRGSIEDAVAAGEISVNEIVAEFKRQLESYL